MSLGKIARDCSEGDLRDAFSVYGELARCTLKRGFAFVTFQEQEHADNACREMQGKDLLGSSLFIEVAKERNSGIHRSIFHFDYISGNCSKLRV